MDLDGARQTVFFSLLSRNIFYMNVSTSGLGREYGGDTAISMSSGRAGRVSGLCLVLVSPDPWFWEQSLLK